MKRIFQNDTFIGLGLAFLAFVVYLATLAPTVSYVDSGELAAVASTLGIAHPTGYPVFTMLGWVFAHLPLGHRIIWNLNLLSAVLCSTAIFFFHRLFLFLLSGGESKTSQRIAAAAATLMLAFSLTFWSQALSIEVYPLHLLFLALLLLLFTRSVPGDAGKQQANPQRHWLLFAFVLGLSFANHMTTVLLAPGFLYLFFTKHGFGRRAWTKIGKGAVPFLFGLSPYLYLPLRASQEPLLNWGNPSTLEGFWRHITGQQYQVGMFSALEVASRQLGHFLATFPSEFGYAPLLFAVAGLTRLFLRFRRMFYFTLLLFFGCVLYSVNYDIQDIDAYFLLAYVATAIWIAYGAYSFLEYARGKAWLPIAGAACVAMVLLPLTFHYRAVDESRDYAVEDYTRNMLGSLDFGAVIFSFQWEYFTSAALYLQRVEGVRPDVVVIDKQLLTCRWYYAQLERRHPWLIRDSRAEVDLLLAELDKFDHGLPTHPADLKARFDGVVRSFVAKSLDTRPVYITADMGAEFAPEFERIPSGLALRLFRDSIPLVPPRDFIFRPLVGTNPNIENIKTNYAIGYANQGLDQVMQGDTAMGIEFLRKSLTVRPDFPEALTWLDQLEGH